MPLQVRASDGSALKIDSAVSLEIVDEQGHLAVVISQLPNQSVFISTPGSHRFDTYCHMFKIKPSHVIVHEDADNPPHKRR